MFIFFCSHSHPSISIQFYLCNILFIFFANVLCFEYEINIGYSIQNMTYILCTLTWISPSKVFKIIFHYFVLSLLCSLVAEYLELRFWLCFQLSSLTGWNQRMLWQCFASILLTTDLTDILTNFCDDWKMLSRNMAIRLYNLLTLMNHNLRT